ncbi:M15 family metallopeptidase, partial [Escherichia coli]|uniref:M15 family metallopeptidase n=1 Tax=Escherichia coli TaxID=562 RepID=UPI003EE291E1
FDEMHERSHAYHPSVPPAAQRNRLLLNAIMTGGGFVGISSEWLAKGKLHRMFVGSINL